MPPRPSDPPRPRPRARAGRLGAPRRLEARLAEVEGTGGERPPGLRLVFDPLRLAADLERIEDWADLSPALTLESASGIGKVLRILRAARLAAPGDARVLLGDAPRAEALVARAIGTPLVLEVRPRSEVRFTAWTEEGVVNVDRVADVVEDATAFLVHRRGTRLPVRVPREGVIRRETTHQRWLEVVAIDRADRAR